MQTQPIQSLLNGKINLSMTAKAWFGGIGFTLAFAGIGFGLSLLPGLHLIGPMACAILLAAGYRHFNGYPKTLRSGIQFSSKQLLRLAIVLFGLKLNIRVVLHQGLELLIRDAVMVIAAIGITVLLSRWMKGDVSLSLLLGIGTGVCGAAAIAAVSPILKAKEEETALGAGLIALIGTVFAVGYTIIRPFLEITDIQYGMWSGVSLHEIAHVALAAAPAGQDALAVGLLAKLGRVFLLVPLSFVLMVWMRRKGKAGQMVEGKGQEGGKIEFPWFLVGFVGMSLLGSFVLGAAVPLPAWLSDGLSKITAFVLTMAMVGLGLNVNLRNLRMTTVKSLAAMAIASVLLSLVNLITV
ncbi:YeiH family protein [Paenibacillus solisilvae]|uniref:YeiH family protein n=1 Tax=Paenibacillus solisilvae TaxID=2486751 RepID=A0ABW0VTK1_9BACL